MAKPIWNWLRVILDKIVLRLNVWNDISSGEFSKYDPDQIKYQANSCKRMTEGKTIVNSIVYSGIDVYKIPILQGCGTELVMLVNSLVAPGPLCW